MTSIFHLSCGGPTALYGGPVQNRICSRGCSRVVLSVSDRFLAGEREAVSAAWTERIGPVAALATLRKHRGLRVASHLVRIGARVSEGWQEASRWHDLPIERSSMAPLAHFVFKTKRRRRSARVYTQMMLGRGIFATSAFYAMYAYTDAHVDRFLEALDEVFAELRAAVDNRSVTQLFRGPVDIPGSGG